MKRILLQLPLLLISFTSKSQIFGWAIQQSGYETESVYQIAEDGGGNIYEVGSFWATVDFDPSASVFNITAVGSSDVFFGKLDASGNLVWVKSLGGLNFDGGGNIGLDASNNIYVSGSFQVTADFDPSANTFNITSAGFEDGYIAKYDNAGDLLWAYKFGSTGTDYVQGLVVSNGYIYATGYFQGTVDFDPGPGIYNLTAGPDAAFILKLDEDGNFIWAKSITGTSSTLSQDIAVDSTGNVFSGGEFWGTCDFDPGPGIQNRSTNGFGADAWLLKLDPAGNFLWVDIFSGSNNKWVQAIDVVNEDVSICGQFEGTVDFDPGNGVYSIISNGNYDIFAAKIFSGDGSLVWATGTGGISNEQVYGLSVSTSGDTYLTGFFSGTVDFDPGNNTFPLTALGISDIFYHHLNSSGEFVEAYSFGAVSASGNGNSILADDVGRITFAGGFQYTIDFDPGPGVANHTSIFGTSDCFIAQFNSCTPVGANINISICEGDSIFAGGDSQTIAGEYYDYYVSESGCDSILTTSLTVIPSAVSINNISICDGDSIFTGGAFQTSSGDYYDYYVATSGCDSIVTTSLVVNPPVVVVSNISICEGDSIFAGGAFQTSAGEYYDYYVAASGCDSILNTSLTVNPIPKVNYSWAFADTICLDNPPFPLSGGTPFGGTYDGDGVSGITFSPSVAGVGLHTITYTYTDANGCMSTASDEVFVDVCTQVNEEKEPIIFSVFPNPATESVNIGFSVLQNQDMRLELQNLLGEKVLVEEKYFPSGKQTISMDVRSVPKGIYRLLLINEDQQNQGIFLVIQ